MSCLDLGAISVNSSGNVVSKGWTVVPHSSKTSSSSSSLSASKLGFLAGILVSVTSDAASEVCPSDMREPLSFFTV